MEDFYTRLLKLKKKNHALYNGLEGGEMFPVNSSNKNVYAFIRQKENAKIIIVVNLSKESQTVELTANNLQGTYRELFSKKKVPFNSKVNMQLAPWDYRVYVR
jgi:glycosidase